MGEKFKYYVCFQDDKGNYIDSFGFENKPRVVDIKYIFDVMIDDNSTGLHDAIPNFQMVFDYISVDIMKHKKFIKYMNEQEKIAQQLEKQKKKKTKKTSNK